MTDHPVDLQPIADLTIDSIAAAEIPAWGEDYRQHLTDVVTRYQQSNLPVADLVGRRGPENAAAYHWDALLACSSSARDDPVAAMRVAYHARWVLSLLSPQDTDLQPRVTVIIPVFNAGDLLVDAVESVLEQDYRSTDVLVVDDGSTDGVPQRIANCQDRVRVVRQSNGGTTSARNLGLRVARGDFVHFVDADDLLAADCVSSKVAAFTAIVDADICMSPYQCVGSNGVETAQEYVQTTLGDFDCPTKDMLHTVVRRFAMSLSTAMAPRWVWMNTGEFDEDAIQGGDIRYGFQLALRRSKLIGINRPLTTVGLTPGSLTTNRPQQYRYNGHVCLKNLNDLLSDTSAWPYVGTMLQCYWPEALQASLDERDQQAVQLRSRLRQVIDSLPTTARQSGLSALPILAVLGDHARRRGDISQLLACDKRLQRKLMARTGRIGQQDVNLWAADRLPATLADPNRAALREIRASRNVFSRTSRSLTRCWQ